MVVTVVISADIGGQLGLFMGISFVTLVEFCQYFIRKCYGIYDNPKAGRPMCTCHCADPTYIDVQPMMDNSIDLEKETDETNYIV